ncbi:MAG: SDR family oxidoreductase [Bacteroidaceae bacterium]|jgi:NAD(P)-dependent dehydrogenase (short-subunit alcohol dehydrogenase family)|nr:SDR family oxidoreductase [Bacteroidaceae bacterium]
MKGLEAFRLDGKVALITGGGAGIGKSCALLLSDAGAKVFVADLVEERALQVKQEIEQAGGACGYIVADLSVEDNCRQAVEDCVNTFGRLDILINSAGTQGKHGDLEQEFDTMNFNKVMSVDLGSVYMMCKYAWAKCAEHQGSIINIASLAALKANGPLAYTAAKGAIKSFSKTLAKRLGEKRVRVNTIYPGFILTEMTRGILQMPELKKHFESESPMGMLGEAEDIAYCALYLSSDASRFVTGQDFVIDGGAMCN